MSDVKLREALTYIEGLAVADDARDLATIADVARQALAHPTEAVELTDEEIAECMEWTEHLDCDVMIEGIANVRKAIAAHEAKRSQS